MEVIKKCIYNVVMEGIEGGVDLDRSFWSEK